MKREGILRWSYVLPREMAPFGKEGREGDAGDGKPGRDSVMLSMCWDDWEAGMRDKVQALIDG